MACLDWQKRAQARRAFHVFTASSVPAWVTARACVRGRTDLSCSAS